ncbi:MAG TPA: class I SAM-dependent methyltransferase, partial [Pseudonocardiaceae bacterium]
MTVSLAGTDVVGRLRALRGSVLELGPGRGANLGYYDPRVRWIGVEPDARHREAVRRAADRPITLLARRAERLELPDCSVDAAVATFVLCSVRDPAAVLAELFRVVRPGGQYVFAEHVAAPPGSWLRRAQHAYTVATAGFGARCPANRDSERAIRRAGLTVMSVRRYTLPG